MLAMTPGFHTQNLVSEIFRLTEADEKSMSGKNFDWLEKYAPSKSGEFQLNQTH